MTEIEARKELVELVKDDKRIRAEEYEALQKAIFALEEIQEYRAIGTVEELEQAHENRKGQLIKLPCSVGDTIWDVGEDFISDYEVRKFVIDERGIAFIQASKKIDGNEYWNSWNYKELDKKVFFTREEAEQSLIRKVEN